MGTPNTTCGPEPDAVEVRKFRKNCIQNGYTLTLVRSQSKQPFGKQWQRGATESQLSAVDPSALNTGILAAGFRCIDVDVDDPQVAEAIKRKILERCPGAPIRTRANSSRFTGLVRAADGEPAKQSIAGPHGKVEVLGTGQQFVAHGVHPSGASIEWEGGRGPDTVARDQLPALTEDEVDQLLTECTALLGSSQSTAGPALGHVFEQPGPPPSAINSTVPITNDLAAGIESTKWFDGLFRTEKSTLVRQCLESIDNSMNDPREVWLRVLFAVADAGQCGCPDARELALGWSQRGASWTSEADFDAAWDSYKPGGITVGSLLRMAQNAGLDLSNWRDLALARLHPAPGQAQGLATPSGTLVDPYGFIIIDPNNIPPHRQWSVGTKLINGQITVLAAKGGWGKSAYAISLACSAASGLDLLNEKIWGDPKRVLYINSEDDTDELQRRLISSARHHQLTKASLQNIMIRGVNTPGHETLTTGDDTAPRVSEAGFNALDQIITRGRADIVILDPLGTFCPTGLNDNGVMGQVLLRLKRLAKKHDCAILVVHHTRKDGDLTNVDAIGGASAIVNQARVALMLARMTAEESKNFKGVLPSELWRYFRIVDAKTNLAPPALSTQWYQLVSYELPHAAPPTYAKGDGVQVVDKVDPSKLYVSPAGSATDDAAKRAILRAVHAANPPFSPSSRGGSDRYIVQAVLHTVRQTTGMHWSERDMTKHIGSLVDEMTAAGWLYVADVKVAGNKRKGVMVNWAVTPWAQESTGARPGQGSTGNDRQIRQKAFESIRRNETEGIGAPRPTGASNVPKRCGDLTGQVFDVAPRDSDSPSELPSVVTTCGTDAGLHNCRSPKRPPNDPKGCADDVAHSDPGPPVVSTVEKAPQAAIAADCDGRASNRPDRKTNAHTDSAEANRTALDAYTATPLVSEPEEPKIVEEPSAQNADDNLCIPDFLRRHRE